MDISNCKLTPIAMCTLPFLFKKGIVISVRTVQTNFVHFTLFRVLL